MKRVPQPHQRLQLVTSKPAPKAPTESWWLNLDHAELNAEATRRFQGDVNTFRPGRRRVVYQTNEEAVTNFARKA